MQAKQNESLTVTDKFSTRFFVTVNNAVKSILLALDKMRGGEIFIPKTINSVNIYDLANAISKNFRNSKKIK